MPHSPFERRRRTVARVALYSSLLVVGVATWLVHDLVDRALDLGDEVEWIDVRWSDEPAVRVLQQYLRIDSTSVTGDEYGAALFLGSLLRAAGLDVTIERLGERQANLWAVLEGRNPRALVLAGHLDTEPIDDPEQWEFPPFAGQLSPPWIYGRGAFDMKSYTVAQLFAVLDVAASPAPPARSVILLATSSEEVGSDLGTRWLIREHPDLVDRFWAVVTEGGVVEVVNLGEPVKYWGTETSQKRFVELVACAGDRERLEALYRDLADRGRPADRLRVTPELRTFLAAYAPTRDASTIRNALEHPDETAADVVAFGALPPFLQSFFRDEAVPFPIEPSPAGGWEMRILLHLLPGSETDDVLADLVPPWMTAGVHLAQVARPTAPHGSPLDHPVFEAIHREVTSTYPRQPHGPFVLPWSATDSRYFRQLGIAAYGFSPFFIMTPDTMTMGHANEKLGLPGLRSGVAMYRRLVRRLAADQK